MNNFFKTTIFGGVFFLFPLIVIAIVVKRALSGIHDLVEPLLLTLGVQSLGGAFFVHLLPLLLLVLLCFGAGLAANTPIVGRLVRSLDNLLREKIPGYGLLRTKLGSTLNPGETEQLTPVLVRFDDSWQIAFEVEEVANGKHAVFLPGAPDAWSGSMCVVDAQRISKLDTSVKSVHHMMKRLGKGARDMIEIAQA